MTETKTEQSDPKWQVKKDLLLSTCHITWALLNYVD